jgi:hypothetical protein
MHREIRGKSLFSVVFFFLLSIAASSLLSCGGGNDSSSSDGGDGNSHPTALVGTWKQIAARNPFTNTWEHYVTQGYETFLSDGTMVTKSYDSYWDTNTKTWLDTGKGACSNSARWTATNAAITFTEGSQSAIFSYSISGDILTVYGDTEYEVEGQTKLGDSRFQKQANIISTCQVDGRGGAGGVFSARCGVRHLSSKTHAAEE